MNPQTKLKGKRFYWTCLSIQNTSDISDLQENRRKILSTQIRFKGTHVWLPNNTKADRILVWNNRIYVPRLPDGHEKAIVDFIELEHSILNFDTTLNMSSWFTNTLIATISNLVYVRLLRLQSSYYCKLKANIIFFEAKRKRLTHYKYINIFNATKTLLAIIPGVYLKYNRRREKRTQLITFDRRLIK